MRLLLAAVWMLAAFLAGWAVYVWVATEAMVR